MMTMGAKAFVDTNILLRALLTQMGQHVQADALLKRMISEDAELWISGQVIREFIVQATHPNTLEESLTMGEVIHEINTIRPLFQIADETAAVRAKLLELLQVYPTAGKQVHDANIVATMLVYDITTLLTLNVDDLRRFEDRIKIVTLEEDGA
jgi:predicted nucleic acid-binding protein